jgi:hypothetical protein
MIRTSAALALVTLLSPANPGLAGQNVNSVSKAATPAPQSDRADNRLLIVNGVSGRVMYDDGHEDMFCVTRRYLIGWNDAGRRIYQRNMSCR